MLKILNLWILIDYFMTSTGINENDLTRLQDIIEKLKLNLYVLM